MIRITTTLVAALSTAVTLWVTPAAAAPTPGADGLSAGNYQRQAFQMTNRHRDRHDRASLRSQDCVQRFAVKQARRMARQDRMFHQELGPILRRCGLSTVGENVAYGYSNGRSVVNDGWMRSEGHRRNILHRDYRLMGLGARKSDDGTWYAAQVFGRKAR